MKASGIHCSVGALWNGHSRIAQHVPGGVLRGQSHLLESPVAAHLTIVDALNEVAGDAVAGGLLAAVLV